MWWMVDLHMPTSGHTQSQGPPKKLGPPTPTKAWSRQLDEFEKNRWRRACLCGPKPYGLGLLGSFWLFLNVPHSRFLSGITSSKRLGAHEVRPPRNLKDDFARLCDINCHSSSILKQSPPKSTQDIKTADSTWDHHKSQKKHSKNYSDDINTIFLPLNRGVFYSVQPPAIRRRFQGGTWGSRRPRYRGSVVVSCCGDWCWC